MRSLLLVTLLCTCAPPVSESSDSIESEMVRRGDAGADAGNTAVADAGSPVACAVPRVDDTSVAFKLNPGPRELRRGALYVVYSGMKHLTDPNYYKSSNIYVIKGFTTATGTDVFIFGAGYSDPNGDVLAMRVTRDAMRSGAADAADAHTVIQSCMGLDPARVSLHFITPHWHVDHLNQAFLGGLVALGYDVGRLTIQTHVNDQGNAFCGAPCPGSSSSPPFSDDIKARASTMGRASDVCNAVVATFETPDFGAWNVVATPGHTPGTVSLDNAVLRARIWGGGASEDGSGTCPVPQGYITSDIHNQAVAL